MLMNFGNSQNASKLMQSHYDHVTLDSEICTSNFSINYCEREYTKTTLHIRNLNKLYTNHVTKLMINLVLH